MNDKKIPFNKPFIVGKELYYISQAVSKAHLSGAGPFTGLCHQWIEERLGCVRAFLTHSCTAALEMAAILCDIQPGDEVVMPSFTFVSTANAFVLRGGVPVFVDIHPDSLNMNENLIEEAITPRTRVIAPVHYAGASCAMDAVMDIAGKHDLLVVEDAAQGMLSSYKNKQLGSIGHLGALSFHETKNIISGEGGALLVNRESLIERAEIIWEKGTNRRKFFRNEIDKYTWVDIGSSFLPSELIAAFLYSQLEHAERIVEKRAALFKQYYESLSDLERRGFFQLPRTIDGNRTNGHIFYIIARSRDERESLLRWLNGNGINAVFHYVPLHSSPAGVKHGRTSGRLEVTEDISARMIRLPLYYEMKERDVERVIASLGRFFSHEGV